MPVRLRPARADDAETLRRWDERPHVRESTGDDDLADWDEELAGDPSWRDWWMAEEDGRPVGIVQIIDPAAEPTRYWGDIGEGHRAIDIWIGETDALGRGIGTVMMRFALARCFAAPDVHTVVIDPLERNVRARRFYERLGFEPVGPRRFGSDNCIVYRLTRARFLARAAEFGLEAPGGDHPLPLTERPTMAGHQTHEHTADPNDVPQVDMAQHKQTYEAFLNLMKIGIGAVALLLIGMAVFLV
jgi:aminoglycoside 6'-N-acetyltransferase